MTLKDLEAAGYEIVCGLIQKDHVVVGRWGEAGPVWMAGHEPVTTVAAKKPRIKRTESVDAEDDFSDLLAG